MDLAKITHFLHRGSKERRLSPTDTRVLEGWKWSTLLGYNAAVKKFKTFKTAIGESDYNLPLSSDDVYAFEAWAGRGANDNGAKKINATSLTHYLHALKAWHTFHDATYPYHTEKRVKLMLKASGRQDATLPAKQGKSPVLIPDLADLFRLLLAEDRRQKPGPARLKKELTIREVTTFQNVTTLTIHEAKTAKPGELQTIKLHHMNSPLCPAKAIERRKQATRTDFDALFGYTTGNRRVNLTKRRVNEILRAVWSDL
ncbi:hypothetical protein PSHT_03037, partial [Puccinia striiformis]